MPHIRMLLKISQFVYSIFFCKAIKDLLFMLPYSIFQIDCNTNIQGSIFLIEQNVRVPFLLHELESTKRAIEKQWL